MKILHDSDSPLSKYNDINDDEVLTPSKTDEEDLFVRERKTKKIPYVYGPRFDHANLSSRLCRDIRMLWSVSSPLGSGQFLMDAISTR